MVTSQKHNYIITKTSLHLNIHSLLRILQYLWQGRVRYNSTTLIYLVKTHAGNHSKNAVAANNVTTAGNLKIKLQILARRVHLSMILFSLHVSCVKYLSMHPIMLYLFTRDNVHTVYRE